MILTAHIGKHQFTASYSKMQDMIGINSKLESGNHILLWDFDDIELDDLIVALREIQELYALPTIYILKTNRFKGYHAYCLQEVTFTNALAILATTYGIDESYLRLGACRGFFTLRISPKNGLEPYLVERLVSQVPEDAKLDQIASFVAYRTKTNKAVPEKVIELW